MSEIKVINDPKFGRVELLKGEKSISMTNGHFGGWVQQKDGSYVSVEFAKSLNRAERRKRGIRL